MGKFKSYAHNGHNLLMDQICGVKDDFQVMSWLHSWIGAEAIHSDHRYWIVCRALIITGEILLKAMEL